MMHDDRAVTVVLGFILVLMMSMISLSVVQTTLVPDVCKKAEAEHMEKLTQQVLSLAEVPDSSKTVRLDLGVDYPKYLFLMTPSKGTTSLSFEKFYVNFSYTKILPNGTKVNVIRHIPSYRILIKPEYYFYPRDSLIVENSAVFREAGNTLVSVTKGIALDGGMNIVVYNSSLSSLSSSSSLSLTVVPVSSGGSTSVENLSITFSSINPDFWLSFNSSSHPVELIGKNIVRINVSSTLLSISEIYISTKGSSSLEPSRSKEIYALNPSKSYTLSKGETLDLGVKVVDSFENPVRGVEVNVSVSSSIGHVSPAKTYTDKNGEAYAIFSATSSGSGNVTFNCSYGRVEYSIQVTSSSTTSQVSIDLNCPNPEEDEPSKDVSAYVAYNGNPLPGYEVVFATNSSNAVLNTTRAITSTNGYAVVGVSQTISGVNWYRVYGYAGSAVDYVDVKLNTSIESGVHILPVYIENQLSEQLLNYQVKIAIDDSSILSKMQSDGSDIRIFDRLVSDPYNDTTGKLPYWIEKEPSTGELVLWTKLSLNANENKTVYIYFNNSGVTSESNGSAVFMFFDDFNDGDVSDWYAKRVSLTATTLDGRSVLRLYPTGSTYYQHFAVPNNCNVNAENYIVTAYIYDQWPAGSVLFHYVDDGSWWSLELYYGRNKDVFKPYINGYDEGWVYTHTPCSINAREWYRIEVKATPDKFQMYINNELKWEQNVGSAYRLSGYSKVGFVEHRGYGPLYADWIFIRKYAELEPKVTIGTLIQ